MHTSITDLPRKTLVWQKAAVLGSLWASSEIVLGSFLHNLRVPFAGNFLTGIGIILLITMAHRWTDKGLFWRSGLICALMKSMSPSAVIFGPMIAIFSEAVLMELSVRIFRRNIFSFLLAGVLAMSWNLFHKIASYLIVYGFDIVGLYLNLMKMAEKQLQIKVEDPYWLIYILLAAQVVFGLLAAMLGILAGRNNKAGDETEMSLSIKEVMNIRKKSVLPDSRYSILLLVSNFLMLVTEFVLMGFAPPLYWLSLGCVMLIFWIIRYRRVLKPIAKPRFWIVFFVITTLSAWSISYLSPVGKGWEYGLILGLTMNFRAVVTIIGFAGIGRELSNPKLKDIFKGNRFLSLRLSLEAAFESLPVIIAALPSGKKMLKKPGQTFRQMSAKADLWLQRLQIRQKRRENIIFIIGDVQQGKSTFLAKAAEFLKKNNITAGGFIAPAMYGDEGVTGYQLHILPENKLLPLSATKSSETGLKVGRFYFDHQTMAEGRRVLETETDSDSDIVFVDEVGPWELQSQGWAKGINRLLLETEKPMIWAVRRDIVEKVRDNWNLQNPVLIDVALCHEGNINEPLEIIRRTIISSGLP